MIDRFGFEGDGAPDKNFFPDAGDAVIEVAGPNAAIPIGHVWVGLSVRWQITNMKPNGKPVDTKFHFARAEIVNAHGSITSKHLRISDFWQKPPMPPVDEGRSAELSTLSLPTGAYALELDLYSLNFKFGSGVMVITTEAAFMVDGKTIWSHVANNGRGYNKFRFNLQAK